MFDVPTDLQLQGLAEDVGARLRAARQMLVTAESCTGGWIAKTVTDIAGSSDWFDCGLAAYSYEAKQALLSVNPHTLACALGVLIFLFYDVIAHAIEPVEGAHARQPGQRIALNWLR